jgi:hypothetical protein
MRLAALDPVTAPHPEPLETALHRGLTELRALRDELRVRFHLATQEARDEIDGRIAKS